MKKRIFIISILFIFLLTGCKAKYSLEIKNDTIKETLIVNDDNNSKRINEKDESGKSFYDYSKLYGEKEKIDTDIESFYSGDKCIGSCSFYQKEFFDKNGTVGFKLTNEFSFKEYQYSTIANELIPAFSSSYDGKYLRINGGPNWNYFKDYKNLENIEIYIDTNYEVVSTNMIKVSEGKYQKGLNEGDDIMYITLDTNTTVSIVENNENNNFVKYMIIAIGILFILLFIYIFKDRKKYR